MTTMCWSAFSPYKNTIRYCNFFPSRWGNGDRERLSDMPKATKLVSSMAGIEYK